MSAVLAKVVRLSDNSEYQKKMLSRVSCHGGFKMFRTQTGVREVLRIKGNNIPIDWLQKDVCVYFCTAHYTYLGVIDTVLENDEWISLVCFRFTRIVVDEETPKLNRGKALVYLATAKDARLLDGKPLVGYAMSPSLPP